MCPGARTGASRPTPLQLLLLLWLGLRSGAEPELPGVPLDGLHVILYWLRQGHSPQVITVGMQKSCPGWGKVQVNIGATELVLEIERNNQLISAAYTETQYDKDGRRVTVSPNQTDHCLYHGHVSGYPHSWLTLTLFSGLSGIIVVDARDSYYLQPIRQHGSHHHIIYRTEHLPIRTGTCGNPGNNQSDISMIKEFVHQRHRFRRDSWNNIKYVELYLVADHTEFQKQSRDLSRTKERMIEIANYVDKFYRAFNIRIALIGVEVWTHSDQIMVSEDATKTLYAFLKWRQRLSVHTKHDNAQLVTGITFKGTTIGMATLEGMCSPDSSGGVSMDHSASPIGAAATMAHEIGHNLGLRHDGPGCCLEASDELGGCIMAAATGDPFPRHFSSCSKQQLWEFLEKGGGICLFNLPDLRKLYGARRCGNGYVEEGEECDCGEVQECVNPCCNANNCTLKLGAQCAHGVCCKTCQFQSAGTICRDAAGTCDLPEYCTGASPYCPLNVYHLDGSDCDGNRGYCYTGMCHSHQLQCEQLWGPGARSAPAVCFEEVNVAGNDYGNCGKDPNGNFVKCSKRDVMCGKIQCQSSAKNPKEWNTVPIDTTVRMDGRDVKCRGTFLHKGQHGQEDLPDPGLVKTGTKCADGKVCLDRRCQNVSILDVSKCSEKCHGHGVCNSNRNCHCDPRWAPPLCDRAGLGGSIDSGPILPDDQKALLIGLLFSFLLLIPGSLLSVFCCYRHKATIHTHWQNCYKQPAEADRTVSRQDEDSSQPSLCLRILSELSPRELDQGLSQTPRPGDTVSAFANRTQRPVSRSRHQDKPQRPPAPTGTTIHHPDNSKRQLVKREPPRKPPPPSLTQKHVSQITYCRVPQQLSDHSYSAPKRSPVVQPRVAEAVALFSSSPLRRTATEGQPGKH